MNINRYDSGKEFYTSERCYITELFNDARIAAHSIARARVLPGVTTAWHRLRGIQEQYVMLEGRGQMELGGGQPTPVGPGDVVCIPPDTPQRICNLSDQHDLIFLCICSPCFVAAGYEHLE